jgi:uncharacterized protein (UPF0276 family)
MATGEFESLPQRAGIGLRAAHYREIIETQPDVGWLEVHGENYFCAGGQPLQFLDQLRANYPLSVHCVGMSLGSADRLDTQHLEKLGHVIERFQPVLVSDHLSWGAVDGIHFNDLLPLPYTEEALAVVCRNISHAQEFLGRQILVENVTSYLTFRHSTIPEWEFLAETSRRTGCGILLDVNNIHVNAVNHGFDPERYLAAIPVATVQELHLAGFEDNGDCLIDTHSRPVAPAVWQLYAQAVKRFGRLPTLIEWDADLPPLATLLGEAAKADRIMRESSHVACTAA